MLATLQPLIDRVRTDVCWRKRAGQAPVCIKQPLSDAYINQHLATTTAFGASPIKAGGSTTRVAVLDLDDHKAEGVDVTRAVARVVDSLSMLYGLQPQAFRSRGGHGAHVYLIWDDPQDAYSVRKFLIDVLAELGYQNGTKGLLLNEIEVFPKQNSVPLNGFGNMFILPLAGESVPLEPLLGFEPVARDAYVPWKTSPSVPLLVAPVRVATSDLATSVTLTELKVALDAIPNSDNKELDYDAWRNIVFAIHAASEGSGEGLALAHDFSSRSAKYNAEFLDVNVWPHITLREGGITANTLFAEARKHGWNEDISAMFEALPPITDSLGLSIPGVTIRKVPKHFHPCSDQANANRLANTFHTQLIVSTDRWFAWCGTHWACNDAEIFKRAMALSSIVKAEKEASTANYYALIDAGNELGAVHALGVSDALEKWEQRCEMRPTIDSALYLTKKMLAVSEDLLDRDPWSLNCLNGTIDLRTGALRPHNAADYITRCIPLVYDPNAICPMFEQVLACVTLEHESKDKPLTAFLQRWFGYCATASTREQKFVVHFGTGRNGKSTVLDIIAEVLQDYAGVAAPGLLVAKKSDGHPTEIANLFGKRMVTAHESGEGGTLREDFIKQATGSDKMSARFMHGNFFEFAPTHKIQLLTNHKPSIRGQDEGIWRRVLLMPYNARFGTRCEIDSGIAHHLRDVNTAERLLAEKQGILAWLVRGACAWFADGLEPPAMVLAASKDYQTEQDRILQFLTEACELGLEYEVPLAGDFGGLFPAYQRWCKEGGYLSLGKNRLIAELERLVKGFDRTLKKMPADSAGRRKNTVAITGLRLLD